MASFFVSRVDTEVDARLDRLGTPEAAELKGAAAIANARLAYQAHEQLTATERWQRLARLGARPQRPLWASTGVKNPAYPDTKYVAGLIAPGTVNTMPGATLEAFADHGQVSGDTMTGSYDAARTFLEQLAAAGIHFDDVTEYLERDGLTKFEKSWSELGATVAAELDVSSAPCARNQGLEPGNPGRRRPFPGAGPIGQASCARSRRSLAPPGRQGCAGRHQRLLSNYLETARISSAARTRSSSRRSA